MIISLCVAMEISCLCVVCHRCLCAIFVPFSHENNMLSLDCNTYLAVIIITLYINYTHSSLGVIVLGEYLCQHVLKP